MRNDPGTRRDLWRDRCVRVLVELPAGSPREDHPGPGLDAALAGGAMTRLVVAGAVAVAMWMVGRPAVVGYLLSFGVAFALVVARELPRMARQIREAEAE